jgi:ADP-heptose:LPS heptosyltransferase
MYHDLAKPITNKETQLPELSIQKKPQIPNSVLIHPGVSKLSVQQGMIKTISATEWAKVVESLADSGKKVLLIGGPDDKECIEKITELVPFEKYENLYGTTRSLRDLAELISSAEKFLCSDSAPLHIAVALGVKTYVIFGSTDDKKLVPQNENVIAIKADCNCPLQPCLWEKRQTTCESLDCLKIPPVKIVDTILNAE